MNHVYAGLPKPGHAFYDAIGLETASQVRSPFFRRYLGVDNVRIPSAGTTRIDGVSRPRPLLVLTDLLAHDDRAPGGLVRVGPDEEPWVGCARMLLTRAESLRLLTVLPGDQHLNPALLVHDADSGCVLDPAHLMPSERALVDTDVGLATKMRNHASLSLAEYQRVFGAIVDKEDRNFVPHCREGIVEYVPFALEAFARQRDELMQQAAHGTDLPAPWLVPDFKTGLSCLSAPDRRGLRGNALREILLASQRGLYLEGTSRRHAKLAIVGGTAHEYSVAELVRFLVDLDYSVILVLAMTGGLGIASKRATVLDLIERYGTKLFATYDWPVPEFLGPPPNDYQALADSVRRADEEFHEAWLAEHIQRLTRGRTSQDLPCVVDGHALSRTVVGAP